MGCLLSLIILLVLFFLGGIKVVGIIIALALLCWLPVQYIKTLLFRFSAMKTEAVVVDCETVEYQKGSIYSRSVTHYPILEYTVPQYGLVRSGGAPDGVTIFLKPNIGKKMMIYYNPKNPKEISLPNIPLEIIYVSIYCFFVFMVLRSTFEFLEVNIL